MRWVGIDEAGYGPNLGPLVLAAVVAEGPDDRPPDLWADLPKIGRAGSSSDLVWVDDSKAIYRAGKGRDRLEEAAILTLLASGRETPRSLWELLQMLGAGSLEDVELTPWLLQDEDPGFPEPSTRLRLEASVAMRPLEGAAWKIVDVLAVVVGPALFNQDLAAANTKAVSHFRGFARLLAPLWAGCGDGQAVRVRSDKHGGRHYYEASLSTAFPDATIEKGPEGPLLSRYLLTAPGRSLELSLLPRADAEDGLVALASILAKTVREAWMAAFNAHWCRQVPGLKPTAGYPQDAARFRAIIEPLCQARGLPLEHWWRLK